MQDYDLLRTGSMPTDDFRKGLMAMGLQELSDAELETIEKHYVDPNKPGYCQWTNFLHDVEFGESTYLNEVYVILI